MSRTFSKLADDKAKRLLDQLLTDADVPAYREAMYGLGRELGQRIALSLPSNSRIYVVCTAEDADFLTAGLISALGKTPAKLFLACFWNGRTRLAPKSGEVAPVVKSYVEPATKCDVLIVTKSIISTSCVVKTNLLDVIDIVRASRIIIAAPVMYQTARKSLRLEFPSKVSNLFEFFYFATDSKRSQSGEVIPGIGGMVYGKLGLARSWDRVAYIPDIVKQRRLVSRSVSVG